MKKKVLRLISIMLCLVMCFAILPANVFGWKNMGHVNSADILLLEMYRSAFQKDRAEVSIYAPYDDRSSGLTYAIPEEFRDAILSYPNAFRAGSMGPDFYPDLVTGQMYIHPYNEETGTGSGAWIELLCDAVNSMPKDSEDRKEAMAFTLGFILHYCGDMFGHDFINAFAGGSFPSIFDALGNAWSNADEKQLNYILSHMAEESYMDGLVYMDFYQNSTFTGTNANQSANGYLTIEAPVEFVANTLIYNGGPNGGAAKIYDNYGGVCPQYKYLVDLRTHIYNVANEMRTSINPVYATAVAYLDRWIEDLDTATYALVECFDDLAQYMLLNPDASAAVAFDYVSAWYDEYGVYATPFPDAIFDFSNMVAAVEDAIMSSLGLSSWIALYENWKKTLIRTVVEMAGNFVLGVNDLDTIQNYQERMKNPEVQLEYATNDFDPANGKNFEEFKEYMDRYAEEQSLLATTSPDAIITGSDTTTLEALSDSELEAFYNTMAMFKLVLIGADNFTNLVQELTGQADGTPIVQDIYHNNTAHLRATSVRLDITTTDTQDAGTDDNVFAVVYKLEKDGSGQITRTQVARKLLDISGHNDFEAGSKDSYDVELPNPLLIEEIEVALEQEEKVAAYSAWDCANINVVPMHGAAVLMEIGVGGNAKMDSGKRWELRFQDALAAHSTGNADADSRMVMNLKVEIKTADALSAGTDDDIYMIAYNTDNPGEDWVKVLLDKVNYNDFESNDCDVYDVSLSKYVDDSNLAGIPLNKLGLKIAQESTGLAAPGWDVEKVTVIPYYGNLKLAEAIDCGGKSDMDSGVTWDLDFGSKSRSLTSYSAPALSYTSALDSGLVEFMKSLDEGNQWINDENLLWANLEAREEMFFNLFKGFAPDITYTGDTEAETGAPVTLKAEFLGLWNGIREGRRNAVNGAAKAPAVTGTAQFTVCDAADAVVAEETVSLSTSNGVHSAAVELPEGLPAGIYHVNVAYTADELHNYKDTNETFLYQLEITGKDDKDALVVEPAELDLGMVHYTEDVAAKTITVTYTGEEELKLFLEDQEESAFTYETFSTDEGLTVLSIDGKDDLTVGEYHDKLVIVGGNRKQIVNLSLRVYANVTLDPNGLEGAEAIVESVAEKVYDVSEPPAAWNLTENQTSAFDGWQVNLPMARSTAIYPAGSAFTLTADTTFSALWGDGHNWARLWDYDTENHWHKCLDEGCDAIKDTAAHSLATITIGDDADTITYCSICGYSVEDVYTVVTFDANGGSWPDAETGIPVSTMTAAAKGGKLLAAPDAPDYVGKAFRGWFAEREGGTKLDVYDTDFSEAATVYAQWGDPEGAAIIAAQVKEPYAVAEAPATIDNENCIVTLTVRADAQEAMKSITLDQLATLTYTEGAAGLYTTQAIDFTSEPMEVTVVSADDIFTDWQVFVVPAGGEWVSTKTLTIIGYDGTETVTAHVPGATVTLNKPDNVSDEIVFSGWTVEEDASNTVQLASGTEAQQFTMPENDVVIRQNFQMDPVFTVYGHNVRLQDLIRIGYYFTVDTNKPVDEFGILLSTDENAVADAEAEAFGESVQKVIPAAEPVNVGGVSKNIYLAETGGICPQNLDEVYYAKAYMKSGDKIYYSNVDNYCVLDYAKQVYSLTDPAWAMTKNMVIDLLNYATAARAYFCYTEGLPQPTEPFNSFLTADEKSVDWNEGMNKEYFSVTEEGPFKAAFYGKNANILEAIGAGVYFYDTAVTGGYYWGGDEYEKHETHTAGNASGEAEMRTDVGEGFVKLSVPNIYSFNIYADYFIRGYNAGGELTDTYSVNVAAYLSSLIKLYQNSVKDEEIQLVQLCKAMQVYGWNAKLYFADQN